MRGLVVQTTVAASPKGTSAKMVIGSIRPWRGSSHRISQRQLMESYPPGQGSPEQLQAGASRMVGLFRPTCTTIGPLRGARFDLDLDGP